MVSRKLRLSLGALLAATVSLLLVVTALKLIAAPEADLWARWSKSDESSKVIVSHETWDQLLQQFVIERDDGVALVAYDDFSDDDRQILDEYVASLEDTTVTKLNQDEQRAYWINMYNAVTVKVILDYDPTDSIREIDIASDVLANGPWKAKLVEVEGQELTLDDIEHRILRPIWQDPRTHYAINCGAISCPNLHARAFTAANMEATLDTLAKGYVNDPRGLQVNDGEVHASKIYEWHVRIYASDELREKLSGITSITSYGYDWALNKAPREYSNNWMLNQEPRQYAQATTTRQTRAERAKERAREKAAKRKRRDERAKRRLDALINRDVGAAGGS